MNASPVEFTLELQPESRLDLIDVSAKLGDDQHEALADYRKTLYCSYHTTAGYLEQGLCARLGYDRDAIRAFVESFQHLFPPDAPYRHDQIHLRALRPRTRYVSDGSCIRGNLLPYRAGLPVRMPQARQH